MMNKKRSENIIRYNPLIDEGLTSDIIEERRKNKLTNVTKNAVGKSYLQIFYDNVFNLFNIILFGIAGLMIWGGYYTGLFFLCVLIPNIGIGLYQDIKARILMSKLRVLTQPSSVVIRNKQKQTIMTKDIVLDDIVFLSRDNQVCADSILIEGNLILNESLLTGESIAVNKKPGDILYSGSFVVSGNAFARVDKVGNNNYASSLQNKANKFRRSPSQILRSLRYLFRVLATIVILIGGFTALVYGLQGSLSPSNIKDSIQSISGSMVSMIPSGLYLLTSVALAAAVISLAKKNAQVQDFYSIEMLARSNVLCIDKTGTITDGSMVVKTFATLNGCDKTDFIQYVSDLVRATEDDNPTARAIKQYFDYELVHTVAQKLPFNSDNKYSAATFKGGKTLIMGAVEFLNIANKSLISYKVDEYAKYGYRVLVVGETTKPIANNNVEGEITALGIIVLQDTIRENAIETFRWFKNNGVQIKVISGDSALTTSEIAKQAEIENADYYISLAGLNDEQVKEAALKYTVFGRVTPEQKDIIVQALKENGKTVAMTGDGVNDILALKRADCSIAMASGSDAARNVSHIVLLDSNFASLPYVVSEGRRVINNLQRTGSVFLVKTIFAVFFSILFLLMSSISKDSSIRYPFLTNNMYIWEILGIGMPSFFLALQKNDEQISGSFIGNILKKSIPSALVIILAVSSIFLLNLFQENGIYTGVTKENMYTMCVIIYSFICFVALYRVCSPLDKYRRIVFIIFSAFGLICILLSATIAFSSNTIDPIFKINWTNLTGVNYFITAMIIMLFISIYLIILRSFKEKKEGN